MAVIKNNELKFVSILMLINHWNHRMERYKTRNLMPFQPKILHSTGWFYSTQFTVCADEF